MPSQTARLHQLTVHTSNNRFIELYPLCFIWTSGIDHLCDGHILAYSPILYNSDHCSSLINTIVCLSTLSITRTYGYRTGLIIAMSYQHSDGANHFYTIDVAAPSWQLTQSIHTRSFTAQSTLDIVTSILEDYDFEWKVSDALLAAEPAEAALGLLTPLPLRTQADVSDYDFVTALLADIGISTLWVSGESVEASGYWLLVASLDECELTPIEYSYTQSIQSGQDTIDELQLSAKQLGSSTVVVKADGLSADTIYEGVAEDNSPLAIEDTSTLLGAPSRIDSDETATRLAAQWVRATGSRRELYQASGPMRGLNHGSLVTISNLPSISQLSAYCLQVQMLGIEPASDSVSYHHKQFIQDWLQRLNKQTHSNAIPAHGYSIAHNTGVWVSATLLEATIPYAPYPSQLSLVSSTYTGLTQARTGDSNSSASPSYDTTITDDTLQQTVTTPVYSGISPRDDGTTPPLRNLQLSSGSTHGWQFAPRLGQSVLLTHCYGDIDSPVISRSLYDGIGMGDCDDKDITTRDSGLSDRHNLQGGSSPRWHGSGMGHSQINDDDSHSGWLSGIAQYGLTPDSEVTLSFDDTPSKVGLQWSVNTGSKANAQSPTLTDHATFAPDEHSLALGRLRHRYSNHQSSDSGQGMNLASDHSVQFTGTTGVLLSTFGLSHSQSEHESAWVNDAGQRQLALGSELSSTFSEAKQAHLQSTKEIKRAQESMMAFKTAAQVMDETLNTEVLGAADVLLVSKDSVLASANHTLWTAKSIVRQSGATQSDVVAGSYNLTADKIDTLSGVGGQTAMSGLHMSANREPVAIQAQGGELQLHSQLLMTIGSASGQVNVSSPKRIKLQTSAGASITIDDSGIKLVCPGMIKVQAVKKGLVGGAQVNAPVIALATSGLFSRRFDFNQLLEADILTAGRQYKIVNHTKGTEFYDVLPDDGRTPRIYGTEQDKIEVIIIGHEDAEQLLMIENEIDNSNHDHEDEECCAPEEDDDTTESQPDSYTNLDDNLEDDYYEFGN